MKCCDLCEQPLPDPAFPGATENDARSAAYVANRAQHRVDYPRLTREELARREAEAPKRQMPVVRLDASPESFLGALP